MELFTEKWLGVLKTEYTTLYYTVFKIDIPFKIIVIKGEGLLESAG